jgi:hypothetical protein
VDVSEKLGLWSLKSQPLTKSFICILVFRGTIAAQLFEISAAYEIIHLHPRLPQHHRSSARRRHSVPE